MKDFIFLLIPSPPFFLLHLLYLLHPSCTCTLKVRVDVVYFKSEMASAKLRVNSAFCDGVPLRGKSRFAYRWQKSDVRYEVKTWEVWRFSKVCNGYVLIWQFELSGLQGITRHQLHRCRGKQSLHCVVLQTCTVYIFSVHIWELCCQIKKLYLLWFSHQIQCHVPTLAFDLFSIRGCNHSLWTYTFNRHTCTPLCIWLTPPPTHTHPPDIPAILWLCGSFIFPRSQTKPITQPDRNSLVEGIKGERLFYCRNRM